jgi:hypothetical protein
MTILKINKITLNYINTEKMLADPLIMNLNGPKMTKFTDQIFNKKYSSLSGNVRLYKIN